jgi:hypothetical protein
MFGDLSFERSSLKPASEADAVRLAKVSSKKIIFPLDEVLGLDKLPFKISSNAMSEIAFWVQNIPSYKEALRVLKERIDINLSDETVRAVANHVGKLVFQNDIKRANETWKSYKEGRITLPKNKVTGTLYIEIEGSALHTRGKRGETDEKRKDIGFPTNKLGVLYSLDNCMRWVDPKGEERFRIVRKHYVPHLGSLEEFEKHLYHAAKENGLGERCQTIILCEGSAWVRRIKEDLFPEARLILDFPFLKEKVRRFSRAAFTHNVKKASAWAEEAFALLLSGESGEVLSKMKNLEGKTSKGHYFCIHRLIEENREHMDYPFYLQKGWLIGEAEPRDANKTALLSRLKHTGMRWNKESGQYILSLMSKAKSGLWEREVVKIVQAYGDE